MGRLILILTVLAQFGFAQTVKNDLDGFENFLGEEKSNSLNALVKSFDKFLRLNYPEVEAGNARIHKYLLDYEKGNRYYPDSLPKWKFDYKDISSTLKQLQTSGMRKEIFIYGYEELDNSYSLDGFFTDPFADTNATDLGSLIIEDLEEELISFWPDDMDSTEWQRRIEESERRSDSLLFTNIRGQFLYGLAKFSLKDTTVQSLLEAVNIIGGLPEITMVDKRRGQQTNYDEPFFKRLIVADTYYLIINAENEKKK